jgi:NAD(P)-dependent dehydrogenase (short-subunit alcohol dehydrogenase family)
MDVQFNFTGKNAVVFGGTTGINLAVADAFAAAGASVAVASRKQANVDAAVERLRAHGGKVSGFVCDVRDMDSVSEAFETVATQWGPVDVLVSGAAGNFLAEAAALSSNGFKVVVDIDLNGTFHVMRAGFEHLSPGASVINITAPQAWIPVRYQAHVCAAKAGVDQLTRVLALEWGSKGIRVNAIAPGPIETDLTATMEPADRQAFIDALPAGRFGRPEEIAATAVLLAGPEGGFYVGATLSPNGGDVMY